MNNIMLSGFVTAVTFSHMAHGDKFYKFYLSSNRKSKNIDTIPCVIREKDLSKISEGNFLHLSGEIRSLNMERIGKNWRKLYLYVYVFDVFPSNLIQNNVLLRGYICKKKTVRTTPKGRRIIDFIMASNRSYGRADYIPCIAWGRTADWVERLNIGTELKLYGRLQSREYQKRISEDLNETRVAYEVSISKMEVVEDD